MEQQKGNSPWVAILMSTLGCGIGQIYNKQFLKSLYFLLILLPLNAKSNINEAMIYSFLGQMDRASETLNANWAMIWMGFFYIAMYEAYTTSYKKINSKEAFSVDAVPFAIAVMFGDMGIIYERFTPLGPIFFPIATSLMGIGIGIIIRKIIIS
jgi:hypothetical protein